MITWTFSFDETYPFDNILSTIIQAAAHGGVRAGGAAGVRRGLQLPRGGGAVPRQHRPHPHQAAQGALRAPARPHLQVTTLIIMMSN